MAYSLENTVELTALANAIRAKTGGSGTMTVSQMTSAVSSIDSGGSGGGEGSGSIPSELFTFTGDVKFLFMDNNWHQLLDEYAGDMVFSNINNLGWMFKQSDILTNELSNMVISIGNVSNSYGVQAEQMFYNCSNLTDIPILMGRIDIVFEMFYNCKSLRYIPSAKINNIDFSYMNSSNHLIGNQMFYNCYSLRNVPSHILQNCWSAPATLTSNIRRGSGIINYEDINIQTPYYSVHTDGMFGNCFALDGINGLTAINRTSTANMFNRMLKNTARLNKFTFYTGSNKVREWKSQTIDLSTSGWVEPTRQNYIYYNGMYDPTYPESVDANYPCPHPITDWNSGITNATKITDATSYETYKENIDSWTDDIAYSRYNKTSAVETINSLPDTSAYINANGGTNTIIFAGSAGSATDGGAINTLTSAQIATATAKGWTVSFV